MSNPNEAGDRSGSLSGDDVAQLTGQIAGLTKAGLPLPSGIRALGEEVPPGRLRNVLNRLAKALESGLPLEAALEAQRGRLPSHLRGLVAAGARTGKLGEVLGRFAGYANIGVDLRRSLWMRLAYPVFSLALAIAIFVFVCVVLMTGFAKIFSDFGLALPVLTRVVMVVASAVNAIWWPFVQGLGGLAALLLITCLVLRADVRRSLAWAVPVVGPVWHLSDLAEFSHLLALLLESEIPLVEALPMAGDAVRNSEIASATKVAAREVAEGRPMSQALSRKALFPRGFARILAWAEGNRGLPEALHMAGEMFEARARSQAAFVSTVCSVLAVLSILCGVLTMILAVLLPLIQLIRALAG